MQQGSFQLVTFYLHKIHNLAEQIFVKLFTPVEINKSPHLQKNLARRFG